MKKIFLGVLSLSMLLSLPGCICKKKDKNTVKKVEKKKTNKKVKVQESTYQYSFDDDKNVKIESIDNSDGSILDGSILFDDGNLDMAFLDIENEEDVVVAMSDDDDLEEEIFKI